MPLHDHTGIAVRHISPPLGDDFILVCVHLPSKRFYAEEDQAHICFCLNEIIKENESKVGHTRTVVVGDLNIDPFGPGVAFASGLNAVCDKRIAKNGGRYIDNKRYTYFYNPMWNYFGDSSLRPPGTYFYDSGKCVNYYWRIFDQVLIRPDLIDRFEIERLKIITEINGRSLLTKKGRPNKQKGSDHLPITFSLNI
jgi:exonuclease III